MNKHYALYDQRPEFLTVREIIAASAKDFGDHTAISYRDKPSDENKQMISYVDLEKDVRAAGTELISRGMKGGTCAVIGKLSYSWVISYLALQSIGTVTVPLDPEWKAEDLADTLKNSGATMLITDVEQKEKLPVISEVTGIDNIVYMKEGLGETVKELIAAGCEKVESGDASFDEVTIDPDGLSLLVFTSGTTGQGKGVMLSQRALTSNLYGAQKLVVLGKKTIGVLPPHHTFGSTIGILAPLYVDCELYISNGIRYFANELQRESPDILILVPLFLESFAKKIREALKKQKKEKLLSVMMKASNGMRKVGINMTDKLFASVLKSFGGNMKRVICGGAPLSRDIYYLFNSLGVNVLNGYGITECAPLIAVNRPEHVVPGSVGMPIPCDTVRIDSPDENGEGEICVKGPNVMLGYYKNDEATAAVMDSDGFFHTGDIGKIDEKTGYVYITGRSKNLIILSNGKNVYPEEIEGELSEIPGIAELVVYEGQSRSGVQHDKIVAEIYMDPAFVEAENITDVEGYLKPYLDKYNKTAVVYKRIGLLRIRNEEFPKNTLRKIVRFKLDRSID